MDFMAVNWLAVVVAAVVSWVLGAGWYMVLAKQWMGALGKTAEEMKAKSPDPAPFIWSAAVQLVIAYFLAVLTPAVFDATTVANAVQMGVLIWIGFVVTVLIQNHRYQGMPWSLTAIDGGYLLLVLVAQGIVIGLFGGGAPAVVAGA